MSAPKVDYPNRKVIELVVNKTKGTYTKKEVQDILYSLILVIHDIYRQGKSFNISGLGKFRPLARPPTVRYNPIRRGICLVKNWWQVAYTPDAYAKQCIDEAPVPDWIQIELEKLAAEWEEEMQKEASQEIVDVDLPKRVPRDRTPRTSLENKIRGKYNKSDKKEGT